MMSKTHGRLRALARSAAFCTLAGALPAASLPAQEHHHGDTPGSAWHVGAHGILLGTHVRNAVGGEPDTELYLTQPTLMAGASAWQSRLAALLTVSLEGLTLEGGELAPGAYGEGYVDRRHPHTYLHEAVLTLRTTGADGASLTAGRGFAPFGTDDPMVRPFVRFPVNHHLGQVLERLVLIGAVRRGAVLVEGGLFNGDEPSDASDPGTLDRFGDSWSARVTLLPVSGLEVQGSYADVASPELPLGGGWDQRKLSASARWERGGTYALAEWKRTSERDEAGEVFAFGSVLGETSHTRGAWTAAVRVERTERPEEDRMSAYRTPWPHAELHVLGITRWTIGSVLVQRRLEAGPLRAAPFLETSYAHVGDRERGLFSARETYGSERIWSLSAGVRLGAGAGHGRMGRYGVALPSMEETR